MIIAADFCPVGWHVPTLSDWNQLVEFSGGIALAGGKLKQTGTTVWDSPNVASDDFNFKARGNGSYLASLGGYFGEHTICYQWMREEVPDNPSRAQCMVFVNDSAVIAYDNAIKSLFSSVRLIKNTPYVETITDYDGNVYHVAYIGTQKWLIENLKVTHYNDGTAISEVTSTDDWKNAIAPATFNDWFLPSLPELEAMRVNLHAYGVGSFSNAKYWCALDALSTSGHAIDFTDGIEWTAPKSTLYRVRPMRRFTTTSVYALRDTGPAGGLICYIVNLGGGNYTYYEAGPSDISTAKLWSNISTGVSSSGNNIGDGPTVTAAIIAQVGHTDSAAKLCDDYVVSIGTDGAYCYHNNDSGNKNPYGLLYNFHAVDNVKGLAPTGTRIATKADWETLITFAGLNSGGKLKEVGMDHWMYPNDGAVDKYKFAAVGGAGRSGSSGLFWPFKLSAFFWTADDYSTNNAYYTAMGYANGDVSIGNNEDKKYGFSVRCIVE